MKTLSLAALFLLTLAVLGGCASTNVVSRQEYQGGKIARPGRIIVHDFAATPGDVPSWAATGQYMAQSTPQTAEDIEAGRKLGGEVAKELVADIQSMGLPAERASDQMNPRIGDLVITGYFESVDTGSAIKRVAIGFGSGAAHLKTVAEGFLMTDRGLRRLGSGEIDAGTGKSPGTAVPLVAAVATGNPIGLAVSSAVKIGGEVSGKSTVEGDAKRTADEIAQKLQIKFQEQGWIN